MPIPMFDLVILQTPDAISRATWALTAPYFLRVERFTPTIFSFVLFEYATIPPIKYFELPGMSVSILLSIPPVHDSHTLSVSFLLVSRLARDASSAVRVIV